MALKISNVRLINEPAEIDKDNHNGDVEVDLEDGRVLSATVFTLANLATLMERYAGSGECLGGLYFYCPDMIIVRSYDEATIKKAISDIVETDGLLGPMQVIRSR